MKASLVNVTDADGACVYTINSVHGVRSPRSSIYKNFCVLYPILSLIMDNKRLRRQDGTTPNKKRKRNLITFEMKLDIVRRHENKERSCYIARTLNLSESTVRTILVQSDKIKERSKRLAPLTGTKFLRPRSQTMENMEKRLADWITSEGDKPIPLVSIQEKARELYESIRIELNDVEAKQFVASHGWLERFKKRMKLFNLNPQEAPEEKMHTVDMDLINRLPSRFKAIVDENGFSPKQVFSINEFGLAWRRLPPAGGAEIKVEEKDRVTLILGANASGDYKLKPVIIHHTANPIALRGYSKDHFPVVWKHHPKGIVTSSVFTDYFCNRLTNELKDYCLKEHIPFKILLILNCATHHPQCLEDFSGNIKVQFLPPNSDIFLHPLNGNIIQFFNAHYFHTMLEKLLEGMQTEETCIEETWKNFTIKDCIDTIGQAWEKIHRSYLKSCWYKIWPEHAGEHKPFELIDCLTKMKQEIIALTSMVGIELDIAKITAYLKPPKEELTSEELKQLSVENKNNADDDYGIRTLSSEDLIEALQHIKEAALIFDENDYNRERSSKVVRDLQNAIECYKQMYKDKLKHSTQSYSIGFIKVEAFEESETNITESSGMKSPSGYESSYACEDYDPIS